MSEDEPFASVDDLEKRWRKLTDSERGRAETLLMDATELVKLQSPIWQELLAEHPRILSRIACDMVTRVMLADTGPAPAGVTQFTDTTGPFSNSYTFANPTGDLYLRDQEKRLLGIGRQQAFSVDMISGEVD